MRSSVGLPRRQGLQWDDRLWDDAWERLLTHPERHYIAVRAWRGELPADPFEALIAHELVRRWRRQARNLAFLYGVWIVFWTALLWDDWRTDHVLASPLTVACTLVGVSAVAACVAVRVRLADRLRAWKHPPGEA